MNSFKKRIMIDTRVVVEGNEHGIARHTRELIYNLIHKNNNEIDFYLLVNKNSPFYKLKLPSNFKLIKLRSGLYNVFGQLEMFFYTLKYRPNFFHAPHFIVPLIGNTALIATIHDMNHVALAKNYTLKQKLYYNFFLKRRLSKAKYIVTVSDFSKQEIIKYFQISEEKIKVIYNGVYNNFKQRNEFCQERIKEFLTKYNLPDKYIFASGNQKPHKNLEKLTEAYCLGGFDLPLVILSDSNEKNIELAKRFNKKNKIYFLKYVQEEDFPLLYALSSAFIFPSLYEGFGLPPLEAAACGVPVVVSHTTSLPEIMQDTATYVNPESIPDLQRGIKEALSENNEVIHIRVKNGLKLAQKYTWSNMAQETLELYDKLY
ncbi:glycosyltransferase family 4 protein [Fluviispira sanaruensis]|uniref:Glycosyltransferase family 1 protein n=1 Tax=Fluviispira sanaruensis TaxID=2493639 RepID=A0A4P2VKY4_FLUSA|nr:glycosyltransferase family 1 protein [Fluviispira sanaruensis]BBH52584.1 glycosyltransferase family 1 protein [Fluviispira sanaruensis]